MKRVPGNGIPLELPYILAVTLSLVCVVAGCGSSSPPPPPPPIQVGLSVTSASVQAGIGTQAFTATVQNDSQGKGVTWTLSGTGCSGAGAPCGSLSTSSSLSGAATTYTAPTNPPNPATVTLTATSAADATKSKAATITVTAAVSVNASPTSSMIQFNAIQFFTATVQNDAANQGVNWTLSGPGCSGTTCGTLSATSSASGAPIKYTGPSAVPLNPAVMLTATSKTDPARNAPVAITVTVNPGTTAVSISPLRAAITTWQTQTFVATVTGANDMSVTWEVDGVAGGGTASLGTIDSGGKYTPPTTGTLGGSHTIKTISNADVTKNATAPIGVTDLPGVYTYHNDNSRTGENLKEFALTTANVSSATFGKLFSVPVDGYVYAQPLWMANVNFGGTIHNVVFVATEHDSLYAIDADNGTILWKKSFINLPGISTLDSNLDIGCNDLVPEVGITSTPVIDPSTKTIYVLVRTKESGSYFQRLHALDVITGNEQLGGPMMIQATAPITGGGTLTFDPFIQSQRPALLLQGGHVIISWASHCDHGAYHGWVMSYNAASLAQEAVFNTSTTPTGNWGGIWMSGNGPAADASGNIYFATGNGSWDGISDFGDSIVKLGPLSGGKFFPLDYFTPFNQGTLNGNDTDVGSGGVLLLPDLSGGTNPHLLIQVGKEGKIYVVDTGSLGHICTTSCNGADPQIVQETPAVFIGGMWGSPAYWNGNLYLGGVGDVIKAFPLNAGTFPLGSAPSPSSQSPQLFGYPGPTPSVSSSGNANGIVWALDNTNQGSGNGQILYGYDATNLTNKIYDSTQAGGRDIGGGAVKFAVPTVANGKVYVGGQATLTVYGLLPN